MKIFVLGFDALEYKILLKGEYSVLKQKDYGKVQVNVYPINTEAIWASFITGEKPEKHGIKPNAKLNSTLSEFLKKVSIKLGFRDLIIKHSQKIFSKKMYIKENFKVPTIFDFVGKSVAISIPAYNEWSACIESRKMIPKSLGNPAEERKLAEKAWNDFQQKKEKTLELIDGDWSLLMVHFYIADIIQHIWYYKEDQITHLYNELEETAKEISKKLPEETLLLIVSDHGLLDGYHTPYAFYSCNKRLNLEKPKITDFADIIKENLGVPTKNDLEKIKERLIRLGYIS